MLRSEAGEKQHWRLAQMVPQTRAISHCAPENAAMARLFGEAREIRTPGAASIYSGGIRPEFGALFGRREESFQTPDLLRLSTRQ